MSEGSSLITKTHSGKSRVVKSILGRSRIDHRSPIPQSISAYPYTCDFNVLPDGQVSPPTGTNFNGSTGLCKAYSENNGKIDQVAGAAIITTPVNIDSAWVTTPLNLLSEFPTFKLELDIQIDTLTGTNQFDWMIVASPELTANAGGGEPARALFWISAFGTGIVVFRYRDAGGTFQNLAAFSGSMETGKIIRISLKRGATQTFWVWDEFGITAAGKKILPLNNSLIQSLAGARLAGGDLFTVAANGVNRILKLTATSPSI